MIERFGYEKLMFEAADPPTFKWYLKNVSKDVNLFIDHSQVVEFNAWRLGLWGDPDIWKGKKLSYKQK
jgi:phosphosulfolactate synthase (CoM biosynthesis protein A)